MTQISERIAWFDYAKGICIIMVVMMHSTLGVGEAFADRGLAPEGFMHWVVAYAKPFRMPDFFLLSGLFLSLAIGRGWLHYLDKKLIHFAYFYVLWLAIQMPLRLAAEGGLSAGNFATQFLDALVNPYAPLWFIYVLPLMFIVTKLLHRFPGSCCLAGRRCCRSFRCIPVGAPSTNMPRTTTSSSSPVICLRRTYLPLPGGRRKTVRFRRGRSLRGLWRTALPCSLRGRVRIRVGRAVAAGVAAARRSGAVAIVTAASLMAKFDVAHAIRYCGKNSIVLYISFMIPMAVTRVVLAKTGLVTDTGVASLIVWLTALISPLIVYEVLRRTPLRYLYQRPSWAKLPYQRPLTSGMPQGVQRIDGLPAA